EQIAERPQGPAHLVAAEDEARDRRQRLLACLEHQRVHALLLLVVGDARVDADGVAQEECLHPGLAPQRAQLLDRALPVLRRSELLQRLLQQPGDRPRFPLLAGAADAKLVQETHSFSPRRKVAAPGGVRHRATWQVDTHLGSAAGALYSFTSLRTSWVER